jgi:limonene-1,2-epoxide hydrolase
VEHYLRAVAGQDWVAVEASLAPAVSRQGPFGDDVEGRAPYLAFLRRTMPALAGYRMDVDRVTAPGGDAARLVFVELRETVDIDGVPLVTPECLVFVVGDDGIEQVSIYIRQAAGRAPGRALGSAP